MRKKKMKMEELLTELIKCDCVVCRMIKGIEVDRPEATELIKEIFIDVPEEDPKEES